MLTRKIETTGAHRIAGSDVPIHDAEALTDGGQLAHIQLGEMTYTLRITRQGKLILTK